MNILKLTVLKTFSQAEARMALTLLELLIDALIELHIEMCRSYDIHPGEQDDIPF